MSSSDDLQVQDVGTFAKLRDAHVSVMHESGKRDRLIAGFDPGPIQRWHAVACLSPLDVVPHLSMDAAVRDHLSPLDVSSHV